MRKVVLLVLVIGIFAALSPAQAEVPPNCVIIGEGQNANDRVCIYTANGPGTYAQATPNPWSILAQRHIGFDENTGAKVYQTITLASAGTGPPSAGAIASRGALGNLDADSVVVILERECVPGGEGFDACGQLGTLVAGNDN